LCFSLSHPNQQSQSPPKKAVFAKSVGKEANEVYDSTNEKSSEYEVSKYTGVMKADGVIRMVRELAQLLLYLQIAFTVLDIGSGSGTLSILALLMASKYIGLEVQLPSLP
jgi:cyclopropane fatty-acyl-phospholipid synthase-like methyltransferase